MIIPDTFATLAETDALVIVSSKEHGVIYRIKDGEITSIDHLEHSEPRRSDDEGFFFSGASVGKNVGGAPKESDEEVYKKALDKMIATELEALIAQESPHLLYVFEPEQFKGHITQHLHKHPNLSVHTVRYGNFVKEHPKTLLEYINTYIEEHTTDTKHVDFEKDLNRHS